MECGQSMLCLLPWILILVAVFEMDMLDCVLAAGQ